MVKQTCFLEWSLTFRGLPDFFYLQPPSGISCLITYFVPFTLSLSFSLSLFNRWRNWGIEREKACSRLYSQKMGKAGLKCRQSGYTSLFLPIAFNALSCPSCCAFAQLFLLSGIPFHSSTSQTSMWSWKHLKCPFPWMVVSVWHCAYPP